MRASRVTRISSYRTQVVVAVLLTTGVCAWLICSAVLSGGASVAKGIKSVYCKSTITVPGKKDLVIEGWFLLPDKRRIESDDQIIVNNGRDYWVYNKENKHLSVGQYALSAVPSFDPNKWVRNGVESMWRSQDTNLKEKMVRRILHGVEQDATELDLRMNGQRVAVAILEDKSSGRIAAIITEFLDESGKAIKSQTDEYDYTKAIAEGLFSLEPPTDAVLVQDMADLKWAPDAYLK